MAATPPTSDEMQEPPVFSKLLTEYLSLRDNPIQPPGVHAPVYAQERSFARQRERTATLNHLLGEMDKLVHKIP